MNFAFSIIGLLIGFVVGVEVVHYLQTTEEERWSVAECPEAGGERA